MQQQYHKLWNLWDEDAALMGLSRLPGESNKEIRTRILNIGKNAENATRQGLINALSSAFGYNTYNVLERRIFLLTHTPYMTSTFVVKVDGVEQTQIDESNYASATSGYIVWKDYDGIYTNILEFIDLPSYSRDSTTLRHNGSYVEVTYQYRDGDYIRTYTDKCNEYDTYDESFMGFSGEVEGSIKVHSLDDDDWLDDTSNGLKNSDGTPTEKLKSIWREIDATVPCTWGV